VAASLLAKASNNPALDLAKRRNLVPNDVLLNVPIGLALDIAAHQIASTIEIAPDREFVGNTFQAELWRALRSHDWVSVSAPTSSGKSFILEKWIEHSVASQGTSTIFYIVPTRALISQVETDIRKSLERFGDEVAVSSLPLSSSVAGNHKIFVYTQERFHIYLVNGSVTTNPSLIIMDEAQQIGSEGRGILLQQVLEMATKQFPSVKVLFATPSTRNPQKLLKFAPSGKRTIAVRGTRLTVNQNVIWVEQVPGNPREW
jgi:superfamily II RNA helicase